MKKVAGIFLSTRFEIHPKNCLIRFCRYCMTPMRQLEYEWDSYSRWYTFYCKTCDHQTQISEPIIPEFMEGWKSIPHEPKTAEEKSQEFQGVNNHV